jgi:hypothetical protein
LAAPSAYRADWDQNNDLVSHRCGFLMALLALWQMDGMALSLVLAHALS